MKNLNILTLSSLHWPSHSPSILYNHSDRLLRISACCCFDRGHTRTAPSLTGTSTLLRFPVPLASQMSTAHTSYSWVHVVLGNHPYNGWCFTRCLHMRHFFLKVPIL
jgi:hypothetical protein